MNSTKNFFEKTFFSRFLLQCFVVQEHRSMHFCLFFFKRKRITRPNCVFCELYADSAARMRSFVLFLFFHLLWSLRQNSTYLRICPSIPRTYRHKIVRLSSANFGLIMRNWIVFRKNVQHVLCEHVQRNIIFESKLISDFFHKTSSRPGVNIWFFRWGRNFKNFKKSSIGFQYVPTKTLFHTGQSSR